MRVILTLAALGASAAPLAGQSIKELCDRVGQVEVGQWAAYRLTTAQGPMEMRFAIVGREAVEGREHYWHEMKAETARGTMITQALVPGFPYDQGDVQGMIMKAGDQPAMKMPKSMISMMRGAMERGTGAGATLGDALKRCESAEVVGRETITVPAGTFETIHFRTTDDGAQGEGWVSTDIPFGIVKLTWTGNGNGGEMVLVGRGKDAKSSITETPREMPGMPGRE